MMNVQRLDAHAVPHQHQPPRGFGPQRSREHAAQPRERCRVPLQERFQYNFGIAARFKPHAQAFQFLAYLRVIVNLAIEHDQRIAAAHRLLATVQIDNLQPHHAQRNHVRFVNAILIRSAMMNGPCCFPYQRRVGNAPRMSEAGYPTHSGLLIAKCFHRQNLRGVPRRIKRRQKADGNRDGRNP